MAYSLDRNYETYLALDLAKYAGKWIAVLENKVIASGSDFQEVFEKTKKEYPNKKPLFDWVSDAAHQFFAL